MAKIKKFIPRESLTSKFLTNNSNQIQLPLPKYVPTGFGGIGRKVADIASSTGVGLQGWLDGSADISNFATEIRNPTLHPEMFQYPKFISVDGTPNVELNSWLRHYLRFDALVANLCHLHSTLPISRFGLVGLNDPTILHFFEDMADELNILKVFQNMLFEWFGIGESAIFSRWDRDKGKFVEIKSIDPDSVNVVGHPMANSVGGEKPELYEWIPDEYLKSLLRTDNPFEQEYVEKHFDEEIRYAVENNYTLMLDPFNFTLVRRKLNDRDLRGTSMLMGILRVLLIEDKLREQHYAMADANINPVRHWQVGNDIYVADDARIAGLESVIRQAQHDPKLNVITDHTVKLNVIGATGSTDKMKDDYEWIENYKLTGLWSNKAFVHSEGITYNSSTVGMRVLMGRYLPIRSDFENVFYRKIFLPTSLAQDFYKTTPKNLPNGKSPMVLPDKKYRELMYPLFDWRHKQSLMDDQSIRSMLTDLHQRGLLAFKIITDSLDIDYDYNKEWKEKELNTPFDPSIMETRTAIMQSAMAGGLADSGEGIAKRVFDASVNFVKLLLNKTPNIQVQETEESKKEKEQFNEKDNGGALQPPTNEATKADVEKQQRYFKSLYFNDYQLPNYKSNLRHIDLVKEMIKKAEEKKSPYNTNFGGKDMAVKALKDNDYPEKLVESVKGQLYDLKIILNQEARKYVESGKLFESVNNILQSINSNYYKRLYNINKYFANATLNTLNKVEDVEDLIVPDFEKKYALKVDLENVDIEDKNVRRAIWNTIYPQLEHQIADNFINLMKTAKLYTFDKVGIKNVYVDGEKIPIDKVTNEHLTKVGTMISPDTEMKIRRDIKIKKCAVLNCPVELMPQVVKTINKVGISGEYDLGNVEEYTATEYNDGILKSYLTAKFYNISNEKMKDIWEKHYDLEADEIEWWTKHAMNVVYGREENKEIEDFVKENL